MNKKIFVGGLNWNMNDQDFEQAFAKFGPIAEAKVILDHNTGRSRGFGFITFEDSAHAQQAVEEMDGIELEGRQIKVNEAKDRPRNNNRFNSREQNDRGNYRPSRKYHDE